MLRGFWLSLFSFFKPHLLRYNLHKTYSVSVNRLDEF